MSTRQLLLVNLLTDMFPALAVAVTPQIRKPRGPPDGPDEDEAAVAPRGARADAVARCAADPADRQRGVVTALGATAAWAIGRFTPGSSAGPAPWACGVVGTQLAQTLARRTSPLVLATALGCAAVLVAVVQTPGVSHFFGCTPLGPVAWTSVVGATAAATAVSVIAPNWLIKTTEDAVPVGEVDLASAVNGDRPDRVPLLRVVEPVDPPVYGWPAVTSAARVAAPCRWDYGGSRRRG